MLAWFTTIRLAIIGSIAALAVGFYAGQRWEKADRYDDAQKQIAALDAAFKKSVENVSTAWKDEAEKARIKVEEWSLQNQVDEGLIRQLLAGQVVIRREFDDLGEQIKITSDVGTCVFTADAVKLLRAASDAANRSAEAGDTD